MKLHGKVAVIVGGASGIGAATAELFAQEGAKIVIADIDKHKLDKAALKMKEMSAVFMTIKVDVVNENDVQFLVRETIAKFVAIDILVNTVGRFDFCKTEELSLEKWQRVFDVNVTGVFMCCKEIGKIMIQKKSGKIVNFGSTAALSAVPYSAHYTAAKHAVVGLTKALAVEWAKHGVYVNCICPGATATPMLLESTSESFRQERSQRIPLQRFGEPMEQANTALFLASEDSNYITGAVICTDGGVYAMAAGTGTEMLKWKQ